MASNSSNTKYNHHIKLSYESSLINNNNTTYVQANPSNFRAIVQHLTGSPSATPASTSRGGGSAQRVVDAEVGARQMAAFKLHERRQQQGAIRKKLEMIKLNNNEAPHYYHGPMNGLIRPRGVNEVAMVSPVSTLDGLELGLGSPSPRTGPSCSGLSEEEERRVIAQKGFYLHPISPMSGGFRDNEPQLLPLFPLHSPRDVKD